VIPTETLSPSEALSGDFKRGGTIGRFEVTDLLGRGGMGVVLAARDPALDRTVAIKLVPALWGHNREEDRARFVREAQTMAQLSHPNVVTVYEVGEQDGKPFIAMEFVEGSTLRAWQQLRPRTWREVLAIYRDAGRGLAALHAADLIHRDFKPDNVLLGADLRPRVSDFGLATELGEALTESTAEVVDTGRGLTVHGKIVGTPPYMASEQWLGEPATPLTDQFAFCVSLWEALFGERPFAGQTPTELQAQICAGRRTAPRDTRGTPRWLLQALERGMAPTPAMRWPAMDELLAHLARGARRRWWPVVALAGGVLAAGGTTLAFAMSGGQADDCGPRAAAALDAWGPGGREGFAERLRAIDAANAPARLVTVDRFVGPLVADWQRLFADACHSEPRANDALAEQRSACLEARLADLRGLLAQIRDAKDGAALDRSIPALSALDVRGCADAKVLASFTMPPSPGDRSEAAAIAEATRAIELDRIAGRLENIHERGQALLARARKLDHAPTTARALQVVARAEADRNDVETSSQLLRELVTVAARAPDDFAAAVAWLNQLRITSFDRHKPAEALAMIPAAEAAVVRAGEPLELRVLLLQQSANVYMEGERVPDALAALAQAQKLLTAAGADAATSPLHDRVSENWATLGTAYIRAREWDKALDAFEHTLRVQREVYGPDHPLTAFTYLNIGHCYRQKQELEKALAANAEAVRIRRARLGPSPGLAWALNGHANALRELDRAKEALPELEEAFTMAEATMAADDPNRIYIAVGAARLYTDVGQRARAREIYSAAIALGERVGAKTTNLGISYLNRGDLAREDHDCVAAVPDYRRAIELFASYGGVYIHYQTFPLLGEGLCHMSLGRLAEARAPLERAAGLPIEPISRDAVIGARYLLGRVLIRTGDTTRGQAMVAQARTDAAAVSKQLRADLDTLEPAN